MPARREARGDGAGRWVLLLGNYVRIGPLACVDPATITDVLASAELGMFAITRWRPTGSRVSLRWNAKAPTKEARRAREASTGEGARSEAWF